MSNTLDQQQLDAYAAIYSGKFAEYLQQIAESRTAAEAQSATNNQATTGTGQLEKTGFFLWNAVDTISTIDSPPATGSVRSAASSAYGAFYRRYSIVRASALSGNAINNLANENLSAEEKLQTILNLTVQASIAGAQGLSELKTQIAHANNLRQTLSTAVEGAVENGTSFLNEFGLSNNNESYLEFSIARTQGSIDELTDAVLIDNIQALGGNLENYKARKQALQTRLDNLVELDLNTLDLNTAINDLVTGNPAGSADAQKSLQALQQEFSNASAELNGQYDVSINAIQNSSDRSSAATALLDDIPSSMDSQNPRLSNNRSNAIISDFRLDASYQDYLTNSLNSARNDISSLTDTALQQSFARLDNSFDDYNAKQIDLDVRLQALNDFDAGLLADGIIRTDIINGSNSFQGPSIDTLKNDFALSTQELEAAYGQHMHRVSLTREDIYGSVHDIINLPPEGLDIARPTLKRQTSTSLSALDFDTPSIPKTYDITSSFTSISKVSKIDLAVNGLSVAGYAATLVTSAMSLHNAINADYSGASNKERDLAIATASLQTVGGAIGTLSAVLDVVSVFAKSSKVLGPAAAVIGAVADVLLAVGDTIAVFNNPNAQPRDKVLAVLNIFTPALDLMAIGDAADLQAQLRNPNLSNADRWALEGLYDSAVLSAIPILNAFSFAWSDRAAILTASRILDHYGSGGSELTDGILTEFLDDTLNGLVQGYYQANFADLQEQLNTWYESVGAEQIVSIGYGASFSDLSADSQGIYQQVISERLRQDSSNIISKITINAGEEVSSEIIAQQYGKNLTELNYQGHGIYQHDDINWRIGGEDPALQENISANVAIIQYAQSYSGDTRVYDDQGIDNTVFYESSGDRNAGFYMQQKTRQENYYAVEKKPLLLVGGWGEREVMVRKTRTVTYFVHASIQGYNTDYIDLGLGNDNVIIGSQDEHVSISSADWFDPFASTALDDSVTLSAAVTSIDIQLSASNNDDHSLRVVWGNEAHGNNRVDLTNIESLRYIDAASEAGSIIFSDNADSYTLYLDSNAANLIISDLTTGNLYSSGRILAGSDDDVFTINSQVQNLEVRSGAGDDEINIDSSMASSLLIDGGAGNDSLSTAHQSIVIGVDQSLYEPFLQENHLLVDNVENITGTSAEQDFLYLSGDVTLSDGSNEDRYEALLDEGEGLLDITLVNNGSLTLGVENLAQLSFEQGPNIGDVEVIYQGESRLMFNKYSLSSLAIRHGELGNENSLIELTPANLQLLARSRYTENMLTPFTTYTDDTIFLTANSTDYGETYSTIDGLGGNNTVIIANGISLTDTSIVLTDETIELTTNLPSKSISFGAGERSQLGNTSITNVANLYFVEDDITLNLSQHSELINTDVETLQLNDESTFVIAGRNAYINGVADSQGDLPTAHSIYFSAENLAQSTTILRHLNSSDTLMLSGKFSVQEILFSRDGDNMNISLGTELGDQSAPHTITIENWYLGMRPAIVLGDNHALSPGEAESLVGMQALISNGLDSIDADNALDFSLKVAASRDKLWQLDDLASLTHQVEAVVTPSGTSFVTVSSYELQYLVQAMAGLVTESGGITSSSDNLGLAAAPSLAVPATT